MKRRSLFQLLPALALPSMGLGLPSAEPSTLVTAIGLMNNLKVAYNAHLILPVAPTAILSILPLK